MAALSVLRSAADGGRRLFIFSLNPRFAGQFNVPNTLKNAVVVRSMSSGHKRTMEMTPSSFEWRKFKDHMNFYFMLGILPIAAIIGAANLFIGPAELADIPDGYEPKHWEYYRSPISRFFARYIVDSPEKWYERHMHFVAIEKEKIAMRKLEKKIELLVGEGGHRQDSKRWYYIESNDVTAPKGRLRVETDEETRGFK